MDSFERLKATAHYIISLCGDDPLRLGTARLHRILWLVDTQAYCLWRESITGATYVKQRLGPAPKNIAAALEALADEGKVSVQQPRHEGPDFRRYIVREYRSLKDAQTNALTKEHRQLIAAMTEAVCGHATFEISEITHDSVWRSAKMGQEIPMEAAFAASRLAYKAPEDSAFSDKLISKP